MMVNNTGFLELITPLNQIQERGKYTVFYEFSGHVNWFDIKIYIGEWKRKKKPIFDIEYRIKRDIITTHDFKITSWEEVIQAIKQII